MERVRRYKDSLFVSLAIAAAALLGACDNPVDLLDEVRVEVMIGNDRFLEVEYLNPASNAIDVDPNGSILVRFDRTVDLSSVTASTFTILQGSTEISWVEPPEAENDGKALRFSPVTFFTNNTAYSVKISGLVSTTGDTMLEGYEWSFITGEAPAGTISIASNNASALATYTNSPVNTVSLTTNGSSTDSYYITTTDITAWTTAQFAAIGSGEWVGIANSAALNAYNIGTATGMRSVYIVFRKVGASGTKYSSVKKATITYDTAPPVVSSFKIKDSDSPNPYTHTNSPGVLLEQSVADALPLRMQFYNSSWSALEPYATTKAWILSAGDGAKTVQARFYDAAGNTPVSASSAGITLDTVDPTVAPTLTSPATPTNDTTPTWTWAAGAGSGGAGLFSYRFGGALYGSPTSAIAYTAPVMPEGGFVFRVREHDAAGNYGPERTFTVTIDTTPPNASVVTCTVVSPTVLSFAWSSGGGGGTGRYDYELNDSTPDAYTNSTSTSYAPLPLPDGTHRLYVKERDAAGNVSAYGVASATINVTGITPDNGATVNVTSSITVSWPAPLLFYADALSVSVNASTWTTLDTGLTGGTYTAPWTTSGSTLLYWKVSRTNKSGVVTATYGPYQVLIIKK